MSRNLNENAGVLPEMEANAPQPAQTDIRQGAAVKSGLLKGISCGLLIAGIAALGWFSFGLAGRRIYQVDECWNVYVARLIATGIPWSRGADLFQVILSRMMLSGAQSADLFAYAREFSWIIFWLNLLLLAMATGERILSRRWLVALAGAATLVPLWDYGLEVRPDNLMLAGILLIWGLVRFQPPRIGSVFFVGLGVVALEFISIKSLLYTVPISVAILVFPPPGVRQPRWKLFAAWCLGAAMTFFALRLVFKLVGQDYLASSEALRFSPFHNPLLRLLTQTPLLVVVTTAAVSACGATWMRQRRAALNWDGILPEALLLGIAVAALFFNPNPHPYNLLHVVPYAFLLAFRYGAMLWKTFPPRSEFLPVTLSIVAFTHLLPFVMATRWHWSTPNFRQEQLMNLTEDLTDPAKDTFFDGIGMVPARKVCDARAFIQDQSVANPMNGPGPHIRDLLAANPPSVIIPNYRTDRLPKEDQDFIARRYVSMADDLLVLGSLPPAGGGTFQVFHAGRYRITSAEASNVIGTYALPKDLKESLAPQKEELALAGTVDGVPLNGRPMELSVGTHRIECGPERRAAVVWVGPHLDEVPRMPGKNRHLLFVNWY